LEFIEWLEARYPKIRLELIDPVCDELGNNYSGNRARMPKELKDRIDRQLLLPTMRNISEVRQRIADIEGLACIAFVNDEKHNYIYAQFAFGKDPDRWWNEMTPTNGGSNV
jgi:hypothetical protein